MPLPTPSTRSKPSARRPARSEPFRQQHRLRIASRPFLAADVGWARVAAVEVAVGHRHVIARILFRGIAQRLEIPGKMLAATKRLEHHVPGLLTLQDLASDAGDIELRLDLIAERPCGAGV